MRQWYCSRSTGTPKRSRCRSWPAAAFGLLGIALLALGFKVFEWITPKLNVEEELAKGNIAVGVMIAAVALGISLIVVRAIGG